MSEQGINSDVQAATEEFNAEQAGQAATEAQSNSDYLQYHPSAVQDKAKAEEMAYASKQEEEQVVEYANEAMRYAEAAETPNAGHDDLHDDISHEAYRDTFLQRAQEARNKADIKAQQAADAYDSMYGQGQTAHEQAQALKSGSSIPKLQNQIRKDKEPKRGFGSPM